MCLVAQYMCMRRPIRALARAMSLCKDSSMAAKHHRHARATARLALPATAYTAPRFLTYAWRTTPTLPQFGVSLYYSSMCYVCYCFVALPTRTHTPGNLSLSLLCCPTTPYLPAILPFTYLCVLYMNMPVAVPCIRI